MRWTRLTFLPPIIGLALAACGGGAAGPFVPVKASSDQVTVGMNLKISEAGRLKADLNADTAVTPLGQTTSQLTRVRLTFYEVGRMPSKLTSKTGDYDGTTGLMTARGNVVLITQGDKGVRIIKSEELHWDQRADKVWSEQSTTINENGQTLISDGFTSNSAFTNVQGRNAQVQGVKVGNGAVTF